MRLETFSYLPELTPDEVAAQVRSVLERGVVVGIEYTIAPARTTTIGRSGSCRS
jgi:ribulose bisphosphate carboxylase small subunit